MHPEICRQFDQSESFLSSPCQIYIPSRERYSIIEADSSTQQSALEFNEINVSKHVVTYSLEGRKQNSEPLENRGTPSTSSSSTAPYTLKESVQAFIHRGTRTEKRIVWISRYANVKTLEVSWAKVQPTGKESCEAYPARFTTLQSVHRASAKEETISRHVTSTVPPLPPCLIQATSFVASPKREGERESWGSCRT